MNLELQDAAVIARGDGWLSAWVGEEHVMMSAETGTCISLSETGGRIWELMATPLSFQKLCEGLAAEYDVEPSTLRAEVSAFLSSMDQQHAIVIH